jgi:hypothetical protein
MNWWLIGVLAVVGGGSPQSEWMSDYGAARMVARQSGKPLLVAFR